MNARLNAVDRNLCKVIEHLRGRFARRCAFFGCLHQYATQVEGWLKAELIYYLHCSKLVDALAREKKYDRSSRRKVDLYWEYKISSNNAKVWLELKHWNIGYQDGRLWNTRWFFSSTKGSGIRPVVTRLLKIADGFRYILVLATPNPGDADWCEAFSEFETLEPNAICTSLTSCADFPAEFFLGLVRIDRRENA